MHACAPPSYDAVDMTQAKPANCLPPPHTPFGHPLRSLWSLDPGIHFLNNGSFGAALCARGAVALARGDGARAGALHGG